MSSEQTTDVSGLPDDPEVHDGGIAANDGWLSTVRYALGLPKSHTLRDTIEHALKEGPSTSSAFSREERAMLRRLLRFGKCRVEDVMVPRADIIALDSTESIQDLLTTFEGAGVSRVPVFTGTLDDPLGMIHIKDLFRWLLEDAVRHRDANGDGHGDVHPGDAAALNTPPKSTEPKARANGAKSNVGGDRKPDKDEMSDNKPPALNLGSVDLSRPLSIAKIRRPVLFVPPSMPAMNLLIRMQSTRNHMALVIDEYGGTDGLVTIEDLIEQIVGDIEDEHDDAENSHILHDPKLGLIASARTPLEDLESHLNCKILNSDEEEVDTLGGLLFTLVGRVPARGEIVRHASGLEFEVLDADPRRVKTIKVHVPESVTLG